MRDVCVVLLFHLVCVLVAFVLRVFMLVTCFVSRLPISTVCVLLLHVVLRFGCICFVSFVVWYESVASWCVLVT